MSVTTEWGEFIPDASGDVQIVKTVEMTVYEATVRETVDESGALVQAAVSELLASLNGAATVTDNKDGTTTIVYTGYYAQNNIILGDLQKSVIHILNIVMQSIQFADLFEDIEPQAYRELYADQLTAYLIYKKGEVSSR